MVEVRARFVRDVLEFVEREHGLESAAVVQRLGARLGRLSDFEELRSSAPGALLPIANVEELLLGLDGMVGDGTGALLEAAGLELFSRVVNRDGLAVPGDLMATVTRLRAPLEYPFVGAQLSFDIASSSTGFSLYLGFPRRPKSARILRHLAVGAIRAAQRYCREGIGDEMKIFGDALGDRVGLDIQVRAAPTMLGVAVDQPISTRPPSRASFRAPSQSALETVERILAPRRPSSDKIAAVKVESGRPTTTPTLTSEGQSPATRQTEPAVPHVVASRRPPPTQPRVAPQEKAVPEATPLRRTAPYGPNMDGEPAADGPTRRKSGFTSSVDEEEAKPSSSKSG